MMIQVSKAEYRGDYKIWVEFTDGASGVADLKDFLWGPVFAPLLDRQTFERFKISSGYRTIVWPNGADIAPEELYRRAVGMTKGEADVHPENQSDLITAVGEPEPSYGTKPGKIDRHD